MQQQNDHDNSPGDELERLSRVLRGLQEELPGIGEPRLHGDDRDAASVLDTGQEL